MTRGRKSAEDLVLEVVEGDCLERLACVPSRWFDSIVTDPPYGLRFMGRRWDRATPPAEIWAEVLRVAKPGASLLAFGGTRTFHRLACAIEDAGWEVRDCLSWLYGSGFPKSHDVAKAIDRSLEAGEERAPRELSTELYEDEARFCGWMRESSGIDAATMRALVGSDRFLTGAVQIVNTAPAAGPPRMARRAMVPTAAAWERLRPLLATEPPEWIEALVKAPPREDERFLDTLGRGPRERGEVGSEARAWLGWGTALKPAWEPILLAVKPLDGTYAANALAHGVAGLNVEGCRIEPAGRFPANLVLDEEAALELDAASGELRSGELRPEHQARGGFAGAELRVGRPGRARVLRRERRRGVAVLLHGQGLAPRPDRRSTRREQPRHREAPRPRALARPAHRDPDGRTRPRPLLRLRDDRRRLRHRGARLPRDRARPRVRRGGARAHRRGRIRARRLRHVTPGEDEVRLELRSIAERAEQLSTVERRFELSPRDAVCLALLAAAPPEGILAETLWRAYGAEERSTITKALRLLRKRGLAGAVGGTTRARRYRPTVLGLEVLEAQGSRFIGLGGAIVRAARRAREGRVRAG